MRFQDYLNEKITRKEFDTVLDRDEVNCGCEFEFYFESAGAAVHPDKQYIMELEEEANREAEEAEKAIEKYYDEIDKGEGAWEEHESDFPSDVTMPSYKKIIDYFADEWGMGGYRDPHTRKRYNNFNELAFSWYEDRSVPIVQSHLNFDIEDFFDELPEGIEITGEQLMEENFPFDLYKPGWEVVPDSSLGPNGVEVVTSVMKISELIEVIGEVFDWIKSVGYTDSSCGFHVHMSLDNSKYELDPLKLIMFVEEGKIYEHFQQRIGNRYAQSLTKGHLSKITPFTVDDLRKAAKKEKLDKGLNTEKYLGLHLIELEKNHVEFRYMGGEGYHDKFKHVRNNIVNYGYWLSIACDADFKKKEYLKKIQRMADQFNKIFLKMVISKFIDSAEKNFDIHYKMTGISYNKYRQLRKIITKPYYKAMKRIPDPPKDIFNNMAQSMKPLVNKKVQELKKEFTDKIKKVTRDDGF